MKIEITDGLQFLVHTHNGLEKISDDTLKPDSSKQSWKTNARHLNDKMTDIHTAWDIAERIRQSFDDYVVNPLSLASVFYSINCAGFFEKYNNNTSTIGANNYYDDGTIVENAEDIFGQIELIILFDNGYDQPFYIPIILNYTTAKYSGIQEKVIDFLHQETIARIVEAKLTNAPEIKESIIGEVVKKSLKN